MTGLKALQSLDDLAKRTQKWAKGSVAELPKLAEGFVDDFNLRKDVNRIYEEVEKASQRAKAEKIQVSAEDLGFMLGTKMKEDLEMWLPNAPDNAKWLLEEPLDKQIAEDPRDAVAQEPGRHDRRPVAEGRRVRQGRRRRDQRLRRQPRPGRLGRVGRPDGQLLGQRQDRQRPAQQQ